MHDLAFFRHNLEAVAARLATRGFELDLDAFRALDAERRAALVETEGLKARRNAESAEIGKLRKQGIDTGERQQKVREIGERIASLDGKVAELEERFRSLLASVPNTPHESVPVGRSEEDNPEMK